MLTMETTGPQGEKQTTEWSPYSPQLLDTFDTEEIELDLLNFETRRREYHSERILGYTSSMTMQKYLDLHPEEVHQVLKERMCVKDMLTYLNWIYRLSAHIDVEGFQSTWQMPEDYVKSFVVEDGKSQSDILGMRDRLLLVATVDWMPTSNLMCKEWRDYQPNTREHSGGYNRHLVISLKAMAMFIQVALARDSTTVKKEDKTMLVTYEQVASTFVKHGGKFLNNVRRKLAPDSSVPSFRKQVHLSTGNTVKTNAYSVSYDTLVRGTYEYSDPTSKRNL